MSHTPDALDLLPDRIRAWARELGFADVGITDTHLQPHDQHLQNWLDAGLHGDMDYMARHGAKRWQPDTLVEGTRRVIAVRMDYLTPADNPAKTLQDRERAYIARYTLGRDYHKFMRKRLTQLAERIDQALAGYQYRAFVDSAPVLERALAQKAGMGWIGKNTMLINRQNGSFFLLGEIFTDAPLAVDTPYAQDHCGRCRACLDRCPTDAFVGPHVLDARRCIAYLTIESKAPIPTELRPLIGNRVFGCDDC
ncbi:MAG: tRNA epoxyqueuosine(34) reductase QueG, partial [Gammaproteobacteria bacterium]|nr:tRNA epoxyqueuosine(34) reductase QueG [Gammaproteobacteria bacterium]